MTFFLSLPPATHESQGGKVTLVYCASEGVSARAHSFKIEPKHVQVPLSTQHCRSTIQQPDTVSQHPPKTHRML